MVELCTETISIALTAAMNTPANVVTNYVSLGVISRLDEIYYRTIKTALKVQLEDEKCELPIENVDNVNLTKFER